MLCAIITCSTILLRPLAAGCDQLCADHNNVCVAGFSCAHKQTLVPEYSQSSASSVHANDAIGHSHGLGKLDSPLAWCASTNAAGQYWQMDLSSAQSVGGVVTQGRKDASYQVRIN